MAPHPTQLGDKEKHRGDQIGGRAECEASSLGGQSRAWRSLSKERCGARRSQARGEAETRVIWYMQEVEYSIEEPSKRWSRV